MINNTTSDVPLASATEMALGNTGLYRSTLFLLFILLSSHSLQLSWVMHIPLRAMDILKVTIQHPHLSDYLTLSFSAFCSKICLYFTLNPLALLQYFGESSCCGPSVAF